MSLWLLGPRGGRLPAGASRWGWLGRLAGPLLEQLKTNANPRIRPLGCTNAPALRAPVTQGGQFCGPQLLIPVAAAKDGSLCNSRAECPVALRVCTALGPCAYI